MLWPEIIFNRLNINPGTKTIIVDHLGLLTEPDFTSFLSIKKMEWAFAQDVPGILSAIKSAKLVIIKEGLELPAYLKKQASVIRFDIQKLPTEIEPGILNKLSNTRIEALIEYANDTGFMQLIGQNNYKKYVATAERHCWQKEIRQLEENISVQCQSAQNYNDLLSLGELWGHYIYLNYRLDQSPKCKMLDELDRVSEALVLNHVVRDAFYESSFHPKTVDKIIPHIKSRRQQKVALVCFDAMGVAEWYVLQQYLSEKGLRFKEKMLFALIPTMTRISRSAIFYGNTEQAYHLKTINEDKAFAENLSNYTVRSFREGDLTSKEQLLGIEAVKLIYNVFDDLAHKTILPPSETTKHLYFNNVFNYLAKSRIKDELQLLADEGFKLWFCSDHGSVVAGGNGQKIDKYLIEASSKRATIIGKSELAKFYDVNQYEIPFVQEKIVLLAKGRTCFSTKNKTEITHGGISLDELVVPFIEVEN